MKKDSTLSNKIGERAKRFSQESQANTTENNAATNTTENSAVANTTESNATANTNSAGGGDTNAEL